MNNKPKTALITGSYGGLGSAFARIHAKNGGALIISDLNEDRLSEQKELLEKEYSVPVYTVSADLTKAENTKKIYRFCKDNSLSVDYLICNAGFGGQGSFAMRDIEKDMAMLAVNVQANTMLLKLFLPDMISRGSGRVLLVSSISALLPGPLQAVYFASKAYLKSLGNAIWRELKGTGVTLTTVMPGILATDFAEKGHLEDTLLFSKRASPKEAAKKAYSAMLKGKMNVSPCVQLPLRLSLPFVPILPKSIVTGLVFMLQKKRDAFI
ncbi:MAG: SDR family NAD(P)-dependent oxidoreductase [Oscillospiraceae bacterium]|nr:SDR family NAD(P)-dependent oxidoreductase [Oscillospiraceae bacterium]